MITRRSRTWTAESPLASSTLQGIDARLVSAQRVWGNGWRVAEAGVRGCRTTIDVWPVGQASPTIGRIMKAGNEMASAKGI